MHVDTPAVSLTVHDLGGDGLPTLFCHATGFHGLVWGPVARRVPGVHAWAPDFRGHGDSALPPGHDYAWSGFADDVLACVDALGLERPAGVGHSKGGAALLLAEERRPGTFAGLWLFEPVVFSPDLQPPDGSSDVDNPLAAGARRRRARFGSYDEAEANFSSKPPMADFDPEALHAYVRHGFRDEGDAGVVLKCRPEDEAAVYTMGARHQAFEGLPLVTCPVVVARGRVEPYSPSAMAERVAARLPRGELVAWDDVGHFAPMTHPQRVADAVHGFIAATVTPPA